MTTYTGKDGTVKTGSGADSVVNLTGFVIEQAAEELDASIIDGSDSYETESGQLSWSGTIEVLYDPADAGAINLDVGNIIEFQFYPRGDSLESYIGDGLITGISTPVEVNGMIRQTVSLKGDDALTITGSLPLGALIETTTGNPLVETTTGINLIEA